MFLSACQSDSNVNQNELLDSGTEESLVVSEMSNHPANNQSNIENQLTKDAPTVDWLDSIRALANMSYCTSKNDCELIEVGARPCGGPDEYWVTAKEGEHREKLDKLLTQYNQMRRDDNKTNNRVGICVMAPKPLFDCAENKCRTQDLAAPNANVL